MGQAAKLQQMPVCDSSGRSWDSGQCGRAANARTDVVEGEALQGGQRASLSPEAFPFLLSCLPSVLFITKTMPHCSLILQNSRVPTP